MREVIKLLFTGYYIYDGINSSRYHLLFANLDTDRLTQICNSVNYTTEFYKGLNRYDIHSKKWDDSPLSFDIEILSEYPIDDIASKKIKRWMFNSSAYKKLYEDYGAKQSLDEVINGKVKRSYVECVFSNPFEIRKSGNLFGWKCTCMLAFPMATQEAMEDVYTDFANNITIDINSDYNGYVYPYLEIKAGNSSVSTDIMIKNITDNNRSMQIKSVIADSTLYIDCGVGSIVDSSNNSYYDKLSDQKFLRFLQGKNELQIVGDIDNVKFVWNNMRYIM